MNKKRIIIISIIVVMLLLVVFRAFLSKIAEKEQSEKIKMSMVPKVEIVKPFDVETSNTIDSPGRVVAIESVDVVARVQGMILKQNYKDGDYVKKGQLLYTIDPSEYQIAYDRAKAELENAKARQYKAQKDFERAAELVKKDFISKSAYDQTFSERNSANASVKAAQAAVNDASRLLSYTRIVAPITGKISSTDITAGNYISSPNSILTKIVSIDPIFVTYSLDSAIFNQIKDDEIIPNKKTKSSIKVQLTLPDGTVYDKTGSADFYDNEISQSTGSISLRAVFPNPDGALISGDFVNVKVFSNKVLTKLAVPQTAVLQDTDGRYLFIVDENNVAKKVKIETIGQKDNNWIVASGVTKEDNIVSSGIINVRDGAKVQIIEKQNDFKEAKE